MFFTALIILIILILVGNYVYHYYSTPTEVKVDFPPANYMAQIGAQCPNMWDVTAINQKTVTCQNNANLPLSADPRCGSRPTQQGHHVAQITFPTVTEWPVSKKNTKALDKANHKRSVARRRYVIKSRFRGCSGIKHPGFGAKILSQKYS